MFRREIVFFVASFFLVILDFNFFGIYIVATIFYGSNLSIDIVSKLLLWLLSLMR